MREKIIEILRKMHPEIDVATCDRLVEDGILDSLDIVTLVTELGAAFDLSIPAVEIFSFSQISFISASFPTAIISTPSSLTAISAPLRGARGALSPP